MTEPATVSIQNSIGHFIKRYRAAVLARSLVLAVLSSVMAALFIWRLRLFHLSPLISIGLPAGLWLVIIAGLAFWVMRHWLSRRMAAARLDKALGLKERLVTAEEFAGSAASSTLYPMLVEDLARQSLAENVRVPKKIDHSTGVLLAAILLLLLWPSLNQVLPPAIRLPQMPKKEKPQAPAKEQKKEQQPPPNQPSSQPSPADNSNNAQQSQPSGGDSAKQPANQGSSQESQKNQQQPNNQPSSSQQSPATPNTSSGDQQKSSAGQAGQQNPQQAGNESSAGEQSKSKASNAQASSATTNASPASPRDQASGSEEQAQKRGTNTTNSSAQQGRQGQQGTQAGSAGSNYQSASAGQSGPGQKQEGGGSNTGTGSQGAGQSSQSGEALKAEIQGLLKEVSGELKDLQQQLDASSQVRPQAGSQTDPSLYGSSEPMDNTQGGSVAVQLKTDSAPTEKNRPAGGVGSASKDVAADAPQVTPEEAQLSNAPREETPASQQHVPAEYRGIFDQMRSKQPQGS